MQTLASVSYFTEHKLIYELASNFITPFEIDKTDAWNDLGNVLFFILNILEVIVKEKIILFLCFFSIFSFYIKSKQRGQEKERERENKIKLLSDRFLKCLLFTLVHQNIIEKLRIKKYVRNNTFKYLSNLEDLY